MEQFTNESFFALILRVILGILFFFQGFDKVFNIKIEGVIRFFREESRHKQIPEVLLVGSAYLTSFIELIGGAMLILGLMKVQALYILGIDLVMVCAAFSYLRPMWDMQMLFPRLILLAVLLLIPESWDVISIDFLLR